MRKVLTDAQSTNVNPNHYYIWDPTLGGEDGRGAYVSIDLDDEGVNPSASDANIYLQPMQAGFFQTGSEGGTPNLHFDETDKAPQQKRTTTFGFKSSSTEDASKELRVSLYAAKDLENNSTPADGLSIKFSARGINAYDPKDAPKMGNLDENIARVENGNYLALEHRNLPALNDSLPLFINQYRDKDYSLMIVEKGNFDQKVYLKDNYLGEQKQLSSKVNFYNFSVDASLPKSIASGRFSIVFGETSLSNPVAEKQELMLYPNPLEGHTLHLKVEEATSKAHVEIFNMLGQSVYERQKRVKENGELLLKNINLQAGLYVVKVKSDNGNTVSIKLIKK